MKLINSKDVEKMLEDKADPGDLFNFIEEEQSSPCWEAKIDRDNNSLILLTDGNEQLIVPLSKVGEVTVDKLSYYIQFLKKGNINDLAKELKVRKV